MELSSAELDCLIVSLRMRENDIREKRAQADPHLLQVPPHLVEACLVELSALRVKLSAALDRELRRIESRPPAG